MFEKEPMIEAARGNVRAGWKPVLFIFEKPAPDGSGRKQFYLQFIRLEQALLTTFEAIGGLSNYGHTLVQTAMEAANVQTSPLIPENGPHIIKPNG